MSRSNDRLRVHSRVIRLILCLARRITEISKRNAPYPSYPLSVKYKISRRRLPASRRNAAPRQNDYLDVLSRGATKTSGAPTSRRIVPITWISPTVWKRPQSSYYHIIRATRDGGGWWLRPSHARIFPREREREERRNACIIQAIRARCRCSLFWKFLCVPPLITELRMFTESRYTKPSKSLERSPRSLPNISRNIARVGRLIFVIPCRPHSIYHSVSFLPSSRSAQSNQANFHRAERCMENAYGNIVHGPGAIIIFR